MFSHNLCERFIDFLQNRRVLWVGMVLSLTCLFIPHFMPLGFSIGVLLCGTVFYPSRLLRDLILLTKCAYRPDCYEDLLELSELYFRWNESGNSMLQESERERKHVFNEEIEDAEFEEIGHEQDEA